MHKLVSAVLALAIALSVAGCASKKQSPLDKMDAAFDDVRAEVQSVVTDPERAAQADELIHQLQQTYTSTTKSIQLRKDRLRELDEDYDASRTDMEEQLELILTDLQANQQTVLKISDEMFSVLTNEERAEIGKARSKALNAAVAAMDAI